MKFTADDHNNIIIIIVCALVVFFSVGETEIQPWDEGLYASRARACTQQNAWIDQSAYSLGGLYSSTYPPLSIWATAISFRVFGESGFSVRLFSLLCSVAALFVFYGIALRMFPKRFAIIAPALLAGTTVWNHYARLGQMDIPLMLFVLLSLWSLLRSCESTGLKQMLWLGAFALSIASALMTKIVVSMLAPAMLAYVFLHPHCTKAMRVKSLVALLIGVALALPWHIYMASVHGTDFTAAFLVRHVYSVVENNTRSLGIFYYINQLFTSNPISFAAFVGLAIMVRHKNSLWFVHSTHKALDILVAIWFAAITLLCSVAPTKMPNYTLLFLPAAILLSMRGYRWMLERNHDERSILYFFATLLVLIVWSSSQFLRVAMQQLLQGTVHWLPIAFILLIVIVVGAAFLLPQKYIPYISANASGNVEIVLATLLVLRIAYLNATLKEDAVLGGKEIAETLQERSTKKIAYVYHNHQAADTLSPQIAWYLPQFDIHTAACMEKKPLDVYNVPLPFNESSGSVLAAIPSDIHYIVYAQHSNDTISARVRLNLYTQRTVELVTKNYVLFGARKQNPNSLGL